MKNRPLTVGFKPSLWSILLLAFGILALWFTKTILKIDLGVVSVIVAIAPFIIYLILAGRLNEVNVPGGFSLKLSEAAQKRVLDQEKLKAEQIEFDRAFSLEKGDLNLLDRRPLDDYARYIILTLVLEKKSEYSDTPYYQTSAILQYLKTLSQYRNFKFLVILDSDEKVFAYITPWQIMQILEKETRRHSNEFAEAVNSGHKDTLCRRYDLVTRTITITDTNITALEIMVDLKLDALIVVDKDGKLVGVVEQEQILSKLMVAITKSGS